MLNDPNNWVDCSSYVALDSHSMGPTRADLTFSITWTRWPSVCLQVRYCSATRFNGSARYHVHHTKNILVSWSNYVEDHCWGQKIKSIFFYPDLIRERRQLTRENVRLSYLLMRVRSPLNYHYSLFVFLWQSFSNRCRSENSVRCLNPIDQKCIWRSH